MSSPPCKRCAVAHLLDHGSVVVFVDSRREDVMVPEYLRGNPKLTLAFGHELTPEIFDLDLDETSLSGTLSFQGVGFHCILPWKAVYAAVQEHDGLLALWADEIPDGVTVFDAVLEPKTSEEQQTQPKPGSHLKLVD